jgi:hypothetical protein
VGARLKRTHLGQGLIPAGPGVRRHGDGDADGAGPEPGGGGVVLPVTQLEPGVAEAAIQDGVGAVVEGRRVAASADQDSVCGPQLLGRSSGSSLSAAVLCLVKGRFFLNIVNLDNKFIHSLFIVFT